MCDDLIQCKMFRSFFIYVTAPIGKLPFQCALNAAMPSYWEGAVVTSQESCLT